MGEYDGLGPYFGPVKLLGGGANGFSTAGDTGVYKVYVYKVLDAQLGDAGGYSIHSKGQQSGGDEMPRHMARPANRGLAGALGWGLGPPEGPGHALKSTDLHLLK